MTLRAAAVLAVLLAGTLVMAPSISGAQSGGRARVLIVSGVAGEAQYADEYFKQATTMIDALKTRFGVPDSDIVYLAENPTRDAATIKAEGEIVKYKAKLSSESFAKVVGEGKPAAKP